MDDNIVAALAVTCIFGLPVLGWIVSRVLAHQERMEMLRRGVVPPPNARDMRRAMKHGWTPDAMHADAPHPYAYYADVHAQQQLRKGMMVAFVGLALLIGLGFIGYRGDGSFVYGPWLLGGLIPLFVGEWGQLWPRDDAPALRPSARRGLGFRLQLRRRRIHAAGTDLRRLAAGLNPRD
jgi:hypothetical protein